MSSAARPLAPLAFVPIILEKVWGGRALAALGKTLPKPDARYGESWEIADMPSTSVSGAGGGSIRSVIADGPLAGLTLGEALAKHPDAILPCSLLTPAGDFPLLVKFLDASANLSVQVHPSPAYAAAHPGAHLKTECWYILDAQPGACVYIGLADDVSRAEFERLCRAGDPRIEQAMRRIPASRGQMFDLPSGTVHALGAGVLVAEVQTPSDTTFRLYDWGRPGREMHTEQGLACTLDGPSPAPKMLGAGQTRAELVRTPYFAVTEYAVGRGTASRCMTVDGPCVLIGLRGQMRIRGQAGRGFGPGDSLLIPAAARAVTIDAVTDGGVLVVEFVQKLS